MADLSNTPSRLERRDILARALIHPWTGQLLSEAEYEGLKGNIIVRKRKGDKQVFLLTDPSDETQYEYRSNGQAKTHDDTPYRDGSHLIIHLKPEKFRDGKR